MCTTHRSVPHTGHIRVLSSLRLHIYDVRLPHTGHARVLSSLSLHI